jgi:hypothetical protein
MKFVDINFKGPTGATGATGITGPSQYYAQQIINGNQYNGFRFPMSNFTLFCTQQIPSQAEGPIFCPLEPPSLSNFNITTKTFGDGPFTLVAPQSNSLGAFTYSSSNLSVATISGSTITIVGVGNSTITALQAQDGNYSSGSISTPFVVNFSSFTATWEYTNNNGISYTDLSGNISIPYDNNTYTIRVKATSPVGATHTQSGTASATNVNAVAQLTLTGTGNYTGSVTSPSITVSLGTFTATWEYTNNGGTSYTDILSNVSIPYDNNTYTIRVKATSPVGATYTQSGTQSITNVNDIALLTITGTVNYTGSVTSPSITIILAQPNLAWPFVPPQTLFSHQSNSLTLSSPTSNSPGLITLTSQDNCMSITPSTVNQGSGTFTLAGVSVEGVDSAAIYATQAQSGNYSQRTISFTITINGSLPPIHII